MGNAFEDRILIADRDELCNMIRSFTGMSQVGVKKNPGYLTTGELRTVAQYLFRQRRKEIEA